MRQRHSGAWILGAALLMSRLGAAAEIEGIIFADRFEAPSGPLRLLNTGLLRYKVVFKGYVAALYAATEARTAAVLADVAKRLEIHYFWAIKGKDFGSAANQVLARTRDAAALAPLRGRLDRMHALFEDVKPGDRYSLTYVPGTGTELALNGVRKGVIEGADFAAAYFGIWLGDQPLDEPLKQQLLGRAE
jgi:Chalcone isomerase-like